MEWKTIVLRELSLIRVNCRLYHSLSRVCCHLNDENTVKSPGIASHQKRRAYLFESSSFPTIEFGSHFIRDQYDNMVLTTINAPSLSLLKAYDHANATSYLLLLLVGCMHSMHAFGSAPRTEPSVVRWLGMTLDGQTDCVKTNRIRLSVVNPSAVAGSERRSAARQTFESTQYELHAERGTTHRVDVQIASLSHRFLWEEEDRTTWLGKRLSTAMSVELNSRIIEW